MEPSHPSTRSWSTQAGASEFVEKDIIRMQARTECHRVRFAPRIGFVSESDISVNRVENGIVWRGGRVVKERLIALEALRLTRAEIILGSV